jgi:pimeloyl-ACP methyl ester carboxylesterase
MSQKYVSKITCNNDTKCIHQVYIVGHSFGAFLACHFAHIYPTQVQKLLMVCE